MNSRLYYIKNIAPGNLAFLRELEHLSELRDLFNFAGDSDQATGEEVDCFLGAEAAADVGSLDGNRSDEDWEYPAKTRQTRYTAKAIVQGLWPIGG